MANTAHLKIKILHELLKMTTRIGLYDRVTQAITQDSRTEGDFLDYKMKFVAKNKQHISKATCQCWGCFGN